MTWMGAVVALLPMLAALSTTALVLLLIGSPPHISGVDAYLRLGNNAEVSWLQENPVPA